KSLKAQRSLASARKRWRQAAQVLTSSPPKVFEAALAPASRWAISSFRISSDRSSCSSVIALTSPECSNFISRGTRSAQIFMHAAGCCLRTFSITDAPCFLKSAASASRKSLLNDLRVASNEPPGFPGEQKRVGLWQKHSSRDFISRKRHEILFTITP